MVGEVKYSPFKASSEWAVAFEPFLSFGLQFHRHRQSGHATDPRVLEIAQQCPKPSRIRSGIIIAKGYDLVTRLAQGTVARDVESRPFLAYITDTRELRNDPLRRVSRWTVIDDQ